MSKKIVLDEQLYDSAKQGTRRQGKGELLKHLEGVRLTQRQAIKAKCFDCDGMGSSGECDIPSCALYSYSPFKRLASVATATVGGAG